jgi:6-phosphogluconolactonase (cycloisomerase 2 family)
MTLPDPHPDAETAQSLWIGTYAGGGGAGVYPLSATGMLGASYTDACNASFGTYSPRFNLHYLVDEQDDGALGVHRHTDSGWVRLAHVPVDGAAPCHVALDRTQSCIATANYASGSVSLFRLDPASGLPIARPMVHANDGSGPDPERQQSPHAHWVGFGLDNRFLYVADLGTDEVLAFAVDTERGALGEPHTAFKAAPGSGPRHLLFHEQHPRSAYLACELDSTLVALDVDGPDLKPRASLSTLPANWHGPNILAHIGANAAGDRLYVSNRGRQHRSLRSRRRRRPDPPPAYRQRRRIAALLYNLGRGTSDDRRPRTRSARDDARYPARWDARPDRFRGARTRRRVRLRRLAHAGDRQRELEPINPPRSVLVEGWHAA